MKRELLLKEIENNSTIWDLIVIGGGATGLGVALDAILRGLKVALFEASDFAKGTSSRSTKLVHGGVRYLAKGDIGLVMEALYERGLLKKNAPHLVTNQSFIVPFYKWWEGPMYIIGLMMYDLLAGSLSFGRSHFISSKNVINKLPTLNSKSLKGGILYHDGQFDDSRLAINIAQSCVENGGCIMNYMKVNSLLKDENGKISGVQVLDVERKNIFQVKARSVVNATGVFVNSIIQMDDPQSKKLVRPSQGVHIVLDKSFLQSEHSLMIPKTDDGRVLFAIPWHDKALFGTTDTLVKDIEEEPVALQEEIDFILSNAGRYLTRKPEKKDICSVFAGLRPLAAPSDDHQTTKEISRKHKLIISPNNLITITGGKWTTYRRMAEDTVNLVIKTINLPFGKCQTKNFQIHGYQDVYHKHDMIVEYGSDTKYIKSLIIENPTYENRLHDRYNVSIGEVIWSVRNEMARTVEDILARRFRILFIDAKASMEMASKVAEIIADELKYDSQWVDDQIETYANLVKKYTVN
jgi:glycerol-3-phosphate dehydrogenase